MNENYSFGPIFQKILLKKNSRLQPESFQTVISKVRTMQKRTNPINCSYNPNAIIQNTDLAIEQIKRRDFDFTQNIEKEKLKLNFDHKPSKRRSLNCQKKFHAKQQSTMAKSVHAGFKLNDDSQRKFTIKKTLFNFNERLSTSVPDSQRISKKDNSEFKVKPFEKLLGECRKLNFELKKIEGIRQLIEAEREENKIKIEEFLTEKKSVGKVNEEVFMEDQNWLDIQLASACGRNRRIWKMNHTAFVATVDRIINSVPITKS